MPQATQVVNFFKQTLTGGAFEALTPGSGDSNTFANIPVGSRAYLADVRGVDDASPMEVSLIASRFHDQILGIAGWVPDGSTLAPPNRPVSISPPGFDQPIYPSDVLTVQVLGTAGDNANVSIILYYADLPGISARLRSSDAVRGGLQNLVGVDVTVDPSSLVQGDWSTGVSLSAAGRRLDAGKYYAILGFTSGTPLAAVGVSAFETGNLKVGGPVLAEGDHDASLFADLADYYGTPLIPIIAGNNQDNVTVFAADPAAGSTKITVQLAELSSPL
jgi:hypothetical protein